MYISITELIVESDGPQTVEPEETSVHERSQTTHSSTYTRKKHPPKRRQALKEREAAYLNINETCDVLKEVKVKAGSIR